MDCGVQGLAGFVLDQLEQVGMSAGAVEQKERDDEANNDRKDNDCADPLGNGECAVTCVVRRSMFVAIG